MINTRNAGLLTGLGILGAMLAAPASSQVVISQVYGGGGNSGATITNDFVELFNNGTSAFNLAGTSLQYTSATGTAFTSLLNLAGTVQPGRFFLIKLAAGAGGTSFSVQPDQDGSGAGALALGATAGKVAFANTTTLLATASATQSGILDYVGYGTTATNFEGAGPAPAPSNTTSVVRVSGAGFSFVDTNNNSTDFIISNPPVLRNSAVPAPSSVAVMALGGLMPMIAIARRRRAAK